MQRGRITTEVGVGEMSVPTVTLPCKGAWFDSWKEYDPGTVKIPCPGEEPSR